MKFLKMSPPHKNPKTNVDAQSGAGNPDIRIQSNEIMQNPSRNKVRRKTFTKDGMCRSFHGNLYQIKLTLLFAIRAINKHYDFQIASERKDIGKFDDIEIQYNDGAQLKHRMIQVKHSQIKSRKITAKALENEDKRADFGLKKYFESYLKVKHNEKLDLVIFTNICLDKSIETNFIELDEDVVLKISNRKGKRFKLKNNCELVRNLTQKIRSSDIDFFFDFVKILIFAVDQPNEKELNEIIGDTISENKKINFKDRYFEQNCYYNAILEWIKKKEGPYLNNEDFEEMLKTVKQQLSKIQLISLTRIVCEEIKNYGIQFKKHKALKEFLKPTSHEQIPQILILKNSHNSLYSSIKVYQTLISSDEYKNDDCFIFLRHETMKSQFITSHVVEAFGSAHYSNLLVIEFSTTDAANETVFKKLLHILTKYRKKKIVLIVTEATRLPDLPESSIIFKIVEDNKNNLTDLTLKSKKKICKNTKIMFQGVEVQMNILLNNNLHLVNEEILLKIIKKERISISDKLPDLGEVQKYYVSRKFKEIVLEIPDHSTNFFITPNSSLSIDDNPVKRGQDIVLVSKNEEEFEILCKKFKKKNIHWIMKENNSPDGNLYWQRSYGNTISKLQKILDRPSSKSLKDFDEINNKVVIISAPPGMGKSTELTRLANSLKEMDPYLWILRVNLVELSSKLANTSNNFTDKNIKIFLRNILTISNEGENKKCKELISLENELFDICYEDDVVVLLLDGFDEICPDYKEKVLEFLLLLKKSKVKRLCVTTRTYGVLSELENKLLALSLTFEDLKYEDQIAMMVNIWSDKSKPESSRGNRTLESKARKLHELFGENFFNNPLQVKIVAKIYHNRPIGGESDLAVLYKEFIDILFDDIYVPEKLPGMHRDRNKPGTAEVIRTQRESDYIFNKYMALYSIFGEYVGKFLPENYAKLTPHLKTINSAEHRLGTIERTINRKPIFGHQTYAEYFCALFLAENWKTIKFGKYFILQLAKNTMVMQFFGYLMKKNQIYTTEYPIHLAVFQNNATKLEDSIEKNPTKLNVSDRLIKKSPLLCAAKLGYLGLVEILLKHKSEDKNLYKELFKTKESLFDAAFHNYKKIVELFYRRKSKVIKSDLDYILQRARDGNAVDVIEFLKENFEISEQQS
jgi:hypothetical protein